MDIATLKNNLQLCQNKKIYVIIVSVFAIVGCSPRYGFYFCHTGFQPFGSFLLLQQDSTFVHQDCTEWYNLNSFGTWSPIPDKKNCIELKSSSSDYTHIPIHVAESKNDSNRTTIIFKQGAKFYNCQRNELVVNGKRIPIDRDTLILSDIKVDSLRIYLGESKRSIQVLYDSISTNTYHCLDTCSNVFEIALPVYPILKSGEIIYPQYAWYLFGNVPMDVEAVFKRGKWYLGGVKGARYKRAKHQKRQYKSE